MVLASSFTAQVGEQLKAQSNLAQALVRDIAASELHAFRAFTNNPFYTSTVNQMHKCLQDIQADDKAAFAAAAATPRTLPQQHPWPRKQPDTSVFERLGMPQPLVIRIMHSTAQLCSIPGNFSVISFPGLQLFPDLQLSRALVFANLSCVKCTLPHGMLEISDVRCVFDVVGVPQEDAGRQGCGHGWRAHRAAHQPGGLH